MRTEPTKNRKYSSGVMHRCFALILVVALLTQALALSASALVGELQLNGTIGKTPVNPSGIAKLEVDEVTAQLKKDLIKTLNKELVKKVTDYELQGTVGLIITFSDDSLVDAYSRSGYAGVTTYEKFKDSKVATDYKNEMIARQKTVLDRLVAAGLVNEVRYSYVHHHSVW